MAAREVLRQTGLLPHVNAGVLDEAWLRRLKRVSASMGLMLEGTAPSLMLPGGCAHQGAVLWCWHNRRAASVHTSTKTREGTRG